MTIRGKTIRNRLVVPPMVTDFCTGDGKATERYIAYHEEKAKGGWGLIITEDYGIDPKGARIQPCGRSVERRTDGKSCRAARPACMPTAP